MVWLFVVGLNCRKQFTEIVNFCWENLGCRRALELEIFTTGKNSTVQFQDALLEQMTSS